jgi:hypothetical protein
MNAACTRKRTLLAVFMAIALTTSSVAILYAAAVPKAQLPGVITSLGQSPDGYTVSTLAKRSKIPLDYSSLLAPKDVAKYKTVLIAVGASLKGFGSAGVNLDTEMARGKELIKIAKEKKIFTVVVHTGGEGRRESMSNMLLDAVAGQADCLIVLETGNADGYFTKISNDKKIPLILVKNVLDVQNVLKEMFSVK